MHGRVISLSRGMGANRRRLFALVDYGKNARPRFALSACDPDDENEAWVVVQGPFLDDAFLRWAKAAGWNTELARLAPAMPKLSEGAKADG